MPPRLACSRDQGPWPGRGDAGIVMSTVIGEKAVVRYAWMPALVAVVVSLPTSAAASSVELSCGDVVSVDVVLTDDLLDCPGNGLVVGASGITIDLNGHTIDGSEPSDYLGGYGVLVPPGFSDVSVRGGTIRGFSFGVWLNIGGDHQVRGVRIAENLIGVEVSRGEGNLIMWNWIADNRDAGVRLFTADRNTVALNAVTASRWGIIAQDHADMNRIAGNLVIGAATSDQQGVQLQLNSSGNTVVNNWIKGYGGHGISVGSGASASTILRNRVASSGIHGVFVGPASGGTLVVKNRTLLNTVDGMHVAAGATGTTIARNRADWNGGWGIAAYAPVFDGGRNRARGNGQVAQCLGIVCR